MTVSPMMMYLGIAVLVAVLFFLLVMPEMSSNVGSVANYALKEMNEEEKKSLLNSFKEENFEKIVDSAVTQGDVQRVGEIEVVGPHDDLQHRKSVFFQKIALKEPISKTYNYMPNKSYEKNFSVSPDGHADRTNASSYPWSPAMSEHAVYENTKPFSMGFAF